jgi:hypothetical protein
VDDIAQKTMELTKVDVNVMKAEEIKKLAISFHHQEEGMLCLLSLMLVSL